jgi:delta 1-pyrroline-5-carboxylate dehydrogenase
MGRQELSLHETEIISAMVQETSCTEGYAKHNMHEATEFVLETASLATAEVLEGSIPSTTMENCLALVFNEPLGVILSIAPWNAALILGVRSFLGPLVAGNTVVVKVLLPYPTIPEVANILGIRIKSPCTLPHGQSYSGRRISSRSSQSDPAPTRRRFQYQHSHDCSPSC